MEGLRRGGIEDRDEAGRWRSGFREILELCFTSHSIIPTVPVFFFNRSPVSIFFNAYNLYGFFF